MGKKHYDAIDGLRMLASFGIVMMHMAANNDYQITGFVYNTVIPSFTNFVFLFMTVSAFGMCCGYYEKVLSGQVNWSEFYGKRFKKILPFFGILVMVDIVISPSVSSLYQAFADLTLLFGFLPNAGNISVIGVGWFLGLIFVFYLIFPFFCVLIEKKQRAWLAFAISLLYNFACANYFNAGRSNILYCGCFFLAGGLIYLYRGELERVQRWMMLAALVVGVFIYYLTEGNAMDCLLVSSLLLIYAMISSSNKEERKDRNRQTLLQNRVTHFFSGISMEIYLAHMVIFRVLEKIGINRMFGTGWLQYMITVTSVIVGTSIFSVVMQKIIKEITNKIDLTTSK